MGNDGNVRRSIDLIEQYLYEEISLDNLAKSAHYSKYHFHRLFTATTGKTLMEYVRERRLIRAAHELLHSSKECETMKDVNFFAKTHCSTEEKKECLEILDFMIRRDEMENMAVKKR